MTNSRFERNDSSAAVTPVTSPSYFQDIIRSSNYAFEGEPAVEFHTQSPVSAAKEDDDVSLLTSVEEAKRRRAIRKEMIILKRGVGRMIPSSPVAAEAEQVSKIAQMLCNDGEKRFLNQQADMMETNEPELLPERDSPTSSASSVIGNTNRADSFPDAVSSTVASSIAEESFEASANPDHLAELPSGTDPESRRQRRLIRNRLSAALHRQRKRETLDSQKQIIESKDALIEKLKCQASEFQSKCKSLESAMNTLVKYYGKDEIHRVLQMSSQDFAATVSPLPKLASIASDSESSSVSSEEHAVTPSTSPGGSPLHSFSDENIVLPRATLQQAKKRRRNGVLPIVSSLALCAVIGCTMLPPPAFQGLLFRTSNAPDLPIHSRRLLEEEETSSIYSIDKWSEMDLERLVNSRRKNQQVQSSWVISPIETRPNMWSFYEGTPWTVKRSTQLFDFRAVSHASERSTAAVPFALFRPLRREMITRNNLSKSSSVQSIIHAGTPTRTYLRGAIPASMMGPDDDLLNNSNLNIEALPGKVNDRLIRVDEQDSIGSSFLFCPSAHASFSPGFLELAGLSPTNGNSNEKPAVGSRWWDWNPSESYGASALKSEYFEGNDIDLAEDTIDSLLDESHGLLLDTNNKNLNEEESKALVPTLYNKKRGENAFSFSSIGGKAVVNSVTVVQGDDPYMSILFPATAISGDFSVGENQPWIEIGCQVLSARIVDGVNFVGDNLREQSTS
mmetsp:Transcript_17368/g.24744  ORF Transcript_17368/g.24744 Transcript_17368/m.24744 type:complete len:733 (-) Transcript_17368:138-2336(-)